MEKIAIIGASGFIGIRAVEIFHLTQLAEVVPVVRSFSSLARMSKFDLDSRVADACDQEALTKALSGCQSALISVSGDARVINGSVDPIYRAARANGLKRLVYLSSASVHGQAPAPGTDESSPLSENQPIPYNRAKVRAENDLLKLAEEGSIEVVILRPGIVFGPRSNLWTAGLANDLLSGRAYLTNNGAGICNSIYVDNLIHAIQLCFSADGNRVDKQAFIVGDEEQVTWLEAYEPIAHALGIDINQVPRLDVPEFSKTARDVVQDLRASTPVQSMLRVMPGRLKRTIKAALFEAVKKEQSITIDGGMRAMSTPIVTQEMAFLQACAYKLPHTKARNHLNYRAPLTFQEGIARSIAWLEFAGYPVRNHRVPITNPSEPATAKS
jgi:nucleoside-diphosphate-sugar epimerase